MSCLRNKLSVSVFKDIFFENTKIRETLKEAIELEKGIEKYFYPYINAKICKLLSKNGYTIKRLGSGLINHERKEEIDIILEIENLGILGLEVKIAKDLNGLILGYQGPQELKGIKAEDLGSYIKEILKDDIKECITNFRGKRRISQSLITDYLKLDNLIRQDLINFGIILGIYKRYKRKNCNHCQLKNWIRKILQKIRNKFSPLGSPCIKEIEIVTQDDLVLLYIFIEKLKI